MRILLIIIIISCFLQSSPSYKLMSPSVIIFPNVESPPFSLKHDSFSIRRVNIISLQKMIDTRSKFYERYQAQCAQWLLDNNQIIEILKSSKFIDSHEYHYYFDILPCSYEGKIRINGKPATLRINAGSSIVLIVSDKTYYMGYYGDKAFFLIKPGID